jgi:Tfp pilus assembly protein PilN
LALKKLSSGEEAGPLVANINALPTVYQPKPFSFTRVFALPGAAITIGLLVSLVMLIQGASADIASTRVRLNATNQLLQQKLSQRQELAQSITGLQKKIDEAEVSCDNFTSAFDSLARRSNGVNGNLQAAVTSLPDTISLNSINQDDIILTINGWAPSENDVLSYLRNLDDSGNFSGITIPSMERSDSEGIDFTLALGSLEDQDEGVNGNSGITISSLPGNVSLSSISQSESIVTVNGWALGEKDVLSYVRNLDASAQFSEITITSMKKIEDEGMEFTLVLKVGGQG